jgi:HD superfamily phosphohydrolase
MRLSDNTVSDGPIGSLPERSAKSICDGLYGRIVVGKPEVLLMNTPAFLRLQQIKQLGFVYRVWPGATHSRYEHSLGCYHLMGQALRALLWRGSQNGLTSVSQSSIKAVMVASLLHDIGHYPFSHTLEELGSPIEKHEKIGRSIIEGSEIAPILEREYHLSPERVADLIDPPQARAIHPDDVLLRQLLSGTLDVDKLDYLPRDARACHVPYHGVDIPRLFEALRVVEQGGRCTMALTQKGIEPLRSLLQTRLAMFETVYWHHTNRAFDVMLLRAVEDALQTRCLSPNQLTRLDDASLLTLLHSQEMPVSTSHLAADLISRRPYRTVLEVSPFAGSLFEHLEAVCQDFGQRRRLERTLAAHLSDVLGFTVADHEVLCDVLPRKSWDMQMWITWPCPPVGMQSLMLWEEIIAGTAGNLKHFYQPTNRSIRVVVAVHVCNRDARARRPETWLPLLSQVIAS